MDKQDVKQRLTLYRPGDPASLGPEEQEALAQAEADPQLSRWLENHCAFQHHMEAQLASIEVPAGLKERILSSERPSAKRKIIPFPGSKFLILAIAAALTVMVGLTLWSLQFKSPGFDAYRERMARTVQRDYRMNMVSRNQLEIRKYLQQNSPHGDYVLSKPLQAAAGEGCALLSWQGHPVSLICLDGGNRLDLFLFVIERKDLRGAPEGQPQFHQVSKLATVSWTQADKVYLLAARDAAALQKFL